MEMVHNLEDGSMGWWAHQSKNACMQGDEPFGPLQIRVDPSHRSLHLSEQMAIEDVGSYNVMQARS